MKIAVCVKQVPDTEAVIQIAANGKGVVLDGLKFVLNPYDEYAVEEAIRTQEKQTGESIVATVGPARATEALRTAMAMGVDRGIHITEENAADLDSYTTAAVLAKALAGENCDVVFTGVKAVDDDCSQVTQILAELLGMPHITAVTAIEWQGKTAKMTRDIGGGAKEIWEMPLPCVVAVAKGINEPRYASLPGIMKAKKKPIDAKAATALGFGADYVASERIVQQTAFSLPPARKAGEKIDGSDPVVAAKAIVTYLQNEAKVI